MHYVSMDENAFAYKTEGHRHRPEIEQELSRLAGAPIQIAFVPHLIPMTRGILATCYAQPSGSNGRSTRLRMHVLPGGECTHRTPS